MRTQDVFFSQIWKNPCFVKLDLYNLPFLGYCRELFTEDCIVCRLPTFGRKKSFYFMMYQEIAQIVKNLWSIYFDCMSLIRPPPTSFKSISKLGSLYEMMSLWILLIYGRLKRSLWSLFLAEKPSSIILHSPPLATLTVEGVISSLVPLASAQGYVRWYHSFFILLSIQLIEFPMRRLKWRPKTTLFWRKSSFFRRIKTTLPNTICCSTTLALPVTWTRNENTNPKIKSLAW